MYRKLSKVEAPAVPEPPMDYRQGPFAQIVSVVRLYFTRVSGVLNVLLGDAGLRQLDAPNGFFYDVSDQALGIVSTAQAVEFDTTYLTRFVSIASSSQITVEVAGVYRFSVSLQVNEDTGGARDVHVWMARNGTDIGYSTHEYHLHGSGEKVVAEWNFIIDLDEDEYIEIMWTADNVDTSLQATAAAGAHPGIPSAHVSVEYIGQLPETRPTLP
jgi:hypothetical protein